MSRNWYYSDGQQQFGPISESQMRGLISAGNLQGNHLVWADGMPSWIPLGDSELAARPPQEITSRGAKTTEPTGSAGPANLKDRLKKFGERSGTALVVFALAFKFYVHSQHKTIENIWPVLWVGLGIFLIWGLYDVFFRKN